MPDTTILSTPYNNMTNDVASAMTDSLSRTGKGGMQAALAMGGNQINNVSAPTSSSDAATKGYVDGVATGAGTRAFVVAATTGNITIGNLTNGSTLDGVTLSNGQDVLVKDQNTAADNGVYTVGAVPARATLFDTYPEYLGSIIAVTGGTVNADTTWLCMANTGGTLGVTDIPYAPLGSTVSLPLEIGQGGTGQLTAETAFDALKQAASTTYVGAVELATEAETQAGASTTLSVTPAGGASAYEALGKARAVDTKTNDYSLALTDAGKTILMNADEKEITIPANASVAFPVGTYVNISLITDGNLYVQAASGVTLNGVTEAYATLATDSNRFGSALIQKIGTNTWIIPNQPVES